MTPANMPTIGLSYRINSVTKTKIAKTTISISVVTVGSASI